MPRPVWYALDRGLIMESGPGQAGRAVRNATPYLVPIVGDWDNRPSSDPWNPHGTSWSSVPPEDWWLEDLWRRNVWQARHGGYQVHNNAVVFAGTWNKTFTRLTSMEAACESGRHAVNAILDHYICPIRRPDRREKTMLSWEFPFGFLDQGLSSPIRMPTPAGDYCYVFDIENREPADTRALRILDSKFCERSLPHRVGRRRPHVLHPTTRGRSGNVRSHNGLQPAVARLPAGVARAAGAVDGHVRRHAVPRRAVHAAVHAARGWCRRRCRRHPRTIPSSCSATCRPGGSTSNRWRAHPPDRRSSRPRQRQCHRQCHRRRRPPRRRPPCHRPAVKPSAPPRRVSPARRATPRRAAARRSARPPRDRP